MSERHAAVPLFGSAAAGAHYVGADDDSGRPAESARLRSESGSLVPVKRGEIGVYEPTQ
ncbi:hypothetical protein [Paenibacillus alvei]|uniref:hypothetical protein n=1 Tax=Paenibacillus alvei TaxID=44250 RepID=UPI001377CB31|nr:hypothetical protein [Paenibacillus alvei]